MGFDHVTNPYLYPDIHLIMIHYFLIIFTYQICSSAGIEKKDTVYKIELLPSSELK